jgi:hypothetical protein
LELCGAACLMCKISKWGLVTFCPSGLRHELNLSFIRGKCKFTWKTIISFKWFPAQSDGEVPHPV